MVDLQVPVYFQHAHQCYFQVLFTNELGQRLFTLKNPHLQTNKNYLDTNIGAFVNTVKPVLETTCIKRPSALRDHCSDIPNLLKST